MIKDQSSGTALIDSTPFIDPAPLALAQKLIRIAPQIDSLWPRPIDPVCWRCHTRHIPESLSPEDFEAALGYARGLGKALATATTEQRRQLRQAMHGEQFAQVPESGHGTADPVEDHYDGAAS
jgi:hypothetical protein